MYTIDFGVYHFETESSIQPSAYITSVIPPFSSLTEKHSLPHLPEEFGVAYNTFSSKL